MPPGHDDQREPISRNVSTPMETEHGPQKGSVCMRAAVRVTMIIPPPVSATSPQLSLPLSRSVLLLPMPPQTHCLGAETSPLFSVPSLAVNRTSYAHLFPVSVMKLFCEDEFVNMIRYSYKNIHK